VFFLEIPKSAIANLQPLVFFAAMQQTAKGAVPTSQRTQRVPVAKVLPNTLESFIFANLL